MQGIVVVNDEPAKSKLEAGTDQIGDGTLVRMIGAVQLLPFHIDGKQDRSVGNRLVFTYFDEKTRCLQSTHNKIPDAQALQGVEAFQTVEAAADFEG